MRRVGAWFVSAAGQAAPRFCHNCTQRQRVQRALAPVLTGRPLEFRTFRPWSLAEPLTANRANPLLILPVVRVNSLRGRLLPNSRCPLELSTEGLPDLLGSSFRCGEGL